ncbi:hypothetical protein F5Y08DRAFT_335043 [Xylaria arbuscula]|nr:hypothetical protein F5Y08DRAFT_335043 [Xylaria arbuscula]
MDSAKTGHATAPENQRISKQRTEEEVLAGSGWTTFNDTTANKIFMPGWLYFKGLLHATDKLCVCGTIVVNGKLECEGNFSLYKGAVQCRYHPAIVKNLIVCDHGYIVGDLKVNNFACINGAFTVTGALTVHGEIRLKGVLRCGSLILNGTFSRASRDSRVIVEGQRIINGMDPSLHLGARRLQQWLREDRQRTQIMRNAEVLRGHDSTGVRNRLGG